MLSQSKLDIKSSSSQTISKIITINSILEAKHILDQATERSLVIFDIGETLVIQRNNLLRIIRNYRIFNNDDNSLINNILNDLSKKEPNVRQTILSNMLLNSPIYLVEPEVKTLIEDLQNRNIKVIAHCSSTVKNFGVFQDYKEWRYMVLKKLGIDFSSSFKQNHLYLEEIKNNKTYCPVFYKGILFGQPKGRSIIALLNKLNFKPSEVICFDDCEPFVNDYKYLLKKNNINYKGFIYRAALYPTPKLDPKIVNVQVKCIKRQKFIDDVKAEKIITRNKKRRI